jgi:hypothetical protein
MMEGESHSMRLCSSGCGFFGSPATDGMCSKCFKESLKKKQSQEISVSPSVSSVSSSTGFVDTVIDKPTPKSETTETDFPNSQDQEGGATSCDSATQSGPEPSGSLDTKTDKDALKKKNRCGLCRKKVGLTGFDCRCGGLYCAVHRYSDKHDCTFDYRELGVQEIRRKNPVVTGQKIQKI